MQKECPLCSENDEYGFRMFDCSHVVCSTCIEMLWTKNVNFNCPYCRSSSRKEIFRFATVMNIPTFVELPETWDAKTVETIHHLALAHKLLFCLEKRKPPPPPPPPREPDPMDLPPTEQEVCIVVSVCCCIVLLYGVLLFLTIYYDDGGKL